MAARPCGSVLNIYLGLPYRLPDCLPFPLAISLAISACHFSLPLRTTLQPWRGFAQIG